MKIELLFRLTYGRTVMAKIEMWFPVTVYREDQIINKEDNDKLIEHCIALQNSTPQGGSDWVGGTYNTHGTHDLSKDIMMDSVIEVITGHVNNFAQMHGCTGTYTNSYSWINIATNKDFQEFHTHNGNIFSAVYYISAPEGSGKIVFEDPKEPDMMPLKSIAEKNTLSYTRTDYTPVTGMLLIFRSYLRHLVEPGTNVDKRISLALNFK